MIAGKGEERRNSRAETKDLVDHFKADLASGAIDVFALAVFDYRRAEEDRLRSLDALQVGVALDDQGLGRTIVAADVTLGEVAEREGWLVLNPRD